MGATAAVPDDNNWYAEVGDWHMLGNADNPDCVEAAILHHIMQRRAYAGRPVTFFDADALALLAKWGGPDGTLMRTALDAWKNDGIVLPDGTVDRIDAYAVVDHTDPNWLKRAVKECGGVLLGIRCPVAWLSDGIYMFDVPSGDPGPIDGGHCVFLPGSQRTALDLQFSCVTWGFRRQMTMAAIHAVADEAYCVLNRDWLDADGLNPAGVDWAAAQAAMARLKAA